MPTINDLVPGQRAEVLAITGDPAIVQRLYELGLLEGETIEFLATAPLGDPVEILLGNARLALRRTDAAGVLVAPR